MTSFAQDCISSRWANSTCGVVTLISGSSSTTAGTADVSLLLIIELGVMSCFDHEHGLEPKWTLSWNRLAVQNTSLARYQNGQFGPFWGPGRNPSQNGSREAAQNTSLARYQNGQFGPFWGPGRNPSQNGSREAAQNTSLARYQNGQFGSFWAPGRNPSQSGFQKAVPILTCAGSMNHVLLGHS